MILSTQCILIVGLARNLEHSLANNVSKISSAFGDLARVKWLVVESDSDDDTLVVLEKLSHDIPEFKYVSHGKLRDMIPSRTARIAYCRNTYLRELALPENAGVDYLAVADLDGVNITLTSDAVRSCWTRSDWDACFANQNGYYYDIWALRHASWSPSDCWAQYNYYIQHGMTKRNALYAAVHSKMLRLPPNSPWIEVDSAFGGLGIYKKNAIEAAAYIGSDSLGNDVCEHVSLNQQLRQNGCRLFINTALINNHTCEHVNDFFLIFRLPRISLRILGRLKRRLAYMLNGN